MALRIATEKQALSRFVIKASLSHNFHDPAREAKIAAKRREYSPPTQSRG